MTVTNATSEDDVNKISKFVVAINIKLRVRAARGQLSHCRWFNNWLPSSTMRQRRCRRLAGTCRADTWWPPPIIKLPVGEKRFTSRRVVDQPSSHRPLPLPARVKVDAENQVRPSATGSSSGTQRERYGRL